MDYDLLTDMQLPFHLGRASKVVLGECLAKI
jgi:hypothetical protein